MLCCAHGAEAVVKKEMGDQGWRLAFSRPGFVTAKHDDAVPPPRGIFVRTASASIGQSRDSDFAGHVVAIKEKLAEGGLGSFDHLHVWPKDRAPIGRFGFEPGTDEVSAAVADELFGEIGGDLIRADKPNEIAHPDQTVLDVVLVEPSHWFFGTHKATSFSPSRWPGGVQPISPTYPPISRAYYKAAEAITWSGFHMHTDDLCVEIGSAPGGACGRLLELGMQVIGIDPADMDPRIAKHPKFKHFRARAGDLPRKEFRGAKWMLVDSNVKPEKTLVTVGNIVTHSGCHFKGLLLTMKIGDYGSASQIDQWRATIEKWKPRSVRVRQLARNRCEVCFAVEF